MGKVDFRSHSVELAVPAEKAYLFLVDLNNLKQLMPDQVINWQSTEDSCAFDIKGMAHITLQRTEAVPGKLVRVVSGPETPIGLEFKVITDKISESKSSGIVELTADLSPMLQLMASGPLQNLVNIMAERLRGVFLSDG